MRLTVRLFVACAAVVWLGLSLAAGPEPQAAAAAPPRRPAPSAPPTPSTAPRAAAHGPASVIVPPGPGPAAADGPIAPTATATATAPRPASGEQATGTDTEDEKTRDGETAAAPGGPVTLAFGGDVHFEAQVAALLRQPRTGLAALRPYLATADLAMVNLETSITTRGTPAPKEYRFRTPPTALTALAGAGVDVVTMANNHAVDYQAVGLGDTLAAKRNSPVRIVGIGANAREAYAPAIFTVKGQRIAVLGASQLRDWTLQTWEATATRPGIAAAGPINALLAAVRAARAQADVVVVYLHWGTERMTCPQAGQREAAKQLSAAGADVVVGAHPHVIQGAGYLGRTFVDYSLGNFVWYNHSSEAGTTTGVLTLTLDGRHVTAYRWTPLRIGTSGLPAAPSTATGARMQQAWQRARGCTGLTS